MKLFTLNKFLINILLNVCLVQGIWPPPYSVNLSHDETFVISELLEDKDVQDVYDEEEIIKKEELSDKFFSNDRSEKFFRLHQQVERYNEKVKVRNRYNPNRRKIYKEYNPDLEEPVPWKAGFVDEKGNFREDEDVVYFGDLQNDIAGIKSKRSKGEKKNDTANYDYNSLKAGYEKNVKVAENANDTLKYSTVKEEESVKDSIKTAVNFKDKPKNCTAEEMKGIGFEAARCLWADVNKPRMKNPVFERAIRIIIIWIILYVMIAVPCWCQYGWCCCCCRCKICRPRENIAEVQKFFAENPIGTFHDEEGNVVTYKPTTYEKYAYKQLEKALNKL